VLKFQRLDRDFIVCPKIRCDSVHFYCLVAILCCFAAANTEAEHIRVDVAMGEAMDLKSSAVSLCYSRDFVRICLHFTFTSLSFGRMFKNSFCCTSSW